MTTYEQIREWFFKIIEKDPDFFNYYGVPQTEAIAIATERADSYLENAVGLICTKGSPQVNFSDTSNTGFNFDFVASEKLLVPMLMYYYYLQRDVAYLATQNVNYTSTDIRVFDPSNARKSFMEMYAHEEQNVLQLLDDYKNTERTTGKYRQINFSLYDTEEE